MISFFHSENTLVNKNKLKIHLGNNNILFLVSTMTNNEDILYFPAPP